MEIFEPMEKKPSMKFLFGGIILFSLSLLVPVFGIQAGERWSVKVSSQLVNGDYFSDTPNSTYYFSTGLRYQTARWNLSARVPIVARNSDLMTQTGGMFFPTGQSHHGNENDSRGSHHDGGMMGNSMLANFEFGLGDVYLYGEYLLFSEQGVVPTVAATGQMKIPTANAQNNYGTGEYDFGMAVSVRKSIHSMFVFSDIGYLNIGDPDGVIYKDPITFGLGFGKFFNTARSSLMLYYQNYSAILPEFGAPRQISLGYNYRLTNAWTLSFIGSKGLSETAPDLGLFLGFDISI